METKMPDEMKNEILWKQAKKRAGFKWSLLMYVSVNLMLIGMWYFTGGFNSYFWPVWSMLGWGLGIVIQYVDAFHGSQFFSTQNEYEKLKKKSSNQ